MVVLARVHNLHRQPLRGDQLPREAMELLPEGMEHFFGNTWHEAGCECVHVKVMIMGVMRRRG